LITVATAGVVVSPAPRLETAAVNVTVLLGARGTGDAHAERKRVRQVIVHEDYRPPRVDSDLALLLLAAPVRFSGLKMPVCLPRREQAWDRCWMAEWAPAYRHGGANVHLQKLRVVQITWKECQRRVAQLSQSMLCAWREPGTRGSGQGDGGAPMVCTAHGTQRLFQVGIFSWDLRSGSRGRPGMFVSVARFIPWIQEETERAGRAYTVSGAPRGPLAPGPRCPLLLGLGSRLLLTATHLR
ncbi:serine protease-like protein 51, partial [Dasypus novemcinctus]|uniref:serine protease-like protein 51 n=1 Tax=Dasypus novemcinctus TaxID=9361 RepID=UPI00265D7894